MRRTAHSKSADGGLTPSTPANLIGTSNPLSRSFIYRRIVHRHGRTLRARGATPHLPLPFHARLRYNPLVHSSTLKMLSGSQAGDFPSPAFFIHLH